MSMTQQDAAEALRQADEASTRSAVLRGYQSTAPHLILWGIVYAMAYTFSFFRPAIAGYAWLVLVPLASAGDMVIAMQDRTDRSSRGKDWSVVPAIFATFLVFITATAAVMQPSDPRQMAAFVPLLVAACYILLGLGTGRRIAFAGIALGVLTLVGYFAFPAVFMLWMAAVGGSTLVLSGLWLRRV